MEPLSLHMPQPLAGSAIAFPLWSRFKEQSGKTPFGGVMPESFFDTGIRVVRPEEARAIVLPNSFLGKPHEATYIRQYADIGEKLGIPVFVFCMGDLTDQVPFDARVYVFRQSVYRSTMQRQDIVIPTLTEDAGRGGISLRTKTTVPVVSFCGQGGYNTIKQQLKYHLKVWLWKIRAIQHPEYKARTVGVYWRRKMMQGCSRSNLVKAFFIVRRSFSGAFRTIELDPVQARKEFVDSIVTSDFVLTPKGDGNYSNRFLEALSLGRIPVLLDTDTVLPLEEEIDYEQVMVRVPMDRVQDTPKLIRAWYDKHTEEDWKLAQVAARELYVRVLRIDSFFSYFFTEVLLTLPTSPTKAKSKLVRHK